MNETERLILEGLWIRINRIPNRIQFEEQWLREVEKALAPQSQEMGYEKDIAEPKFAIGHGSPDCKPSSNSESKSEDKE